jgi:hypothetical protein
LQPRLSSFWFNEEGTSRPRTNRRSTGSGHTSRLDGTNRYHLTPEGVRVAAFYTKLQNRLLEPLLAADQPPAPIELRRALRVIDNAVNDYINHARIRPAA